MVEIARMSQCQHRIYCEVFLQRGSTARELEPTAAYILRVHIGDGWRSSNGQENPQCPSDPSEIIA
jgi:hypothetical protein